MFDKSKSNKTLFNVDFEAIKSTLSSANSLLVERGKVLINTYERLPITIDSSSDLESYNKYVKESESFSKETRSQRLSNSKPFRDATKVVNDFFKAIDDPIDRELRVVKDRINRKMRDEFEKQLEDAQQEEMSEDQDNFEKPLISTNDGEIVMEAKTEVKSNNERTVSLDQTKVQLNYAVDSYDVNNLDFNKLAKYFTDASIMTALKKHLEAEGAVLDGVKYETIAIS